MIKYLFSVVLCSWMVLACQTGGNARESGFLYPAEWEPHESLWMGFRTHDEGLIHEPLLQKMIQVLARHVHVNLVVEAPALFYEKDVYLSMLGVDQSNITVQILNPSDFWFRDSGPLFLVNSKGQMAIADFIFSNYQNELTVRSEKIERLSRIGQKIAKEKGLPVFSSDLIFEGGSFDVNGKGTVLLSNLVLERNPGRTREDIETEIQSVLGQKKIIWLENGLAQDPLGLKHITGNFWGRGTGGHVDEFARFVNATTILLAWIPEKDRNKNPINRLNCERMHKNYKILLRSKDQDNKPFTIIKIPLPDLEVEDKKLSSGETVKFVPAASYLNFLITNGLVLVPGYWSPGKAHSVKQKDAIIKSMMAEFFPERQILQINPASLNRYGGGMHCIYQQEPKVFESCEQITN
ncbi:MAG: agmatine deiminase family protein [Pseudomonadota bacterium]